MTGLGPMSSEPMASAEENESGRVPSEVTDVRPKIEITWKSRGEITWLSRGDFRGR